MVSKSTREQARQMIISRGATYYRDLLARCGVSTFSELPAAVLTAHARPARQTIYNIL
jgi:hypothetical protein